MTSGAGPEPLKPCPFCGEAPISTEWVSGIFRVRCQTSSCPARDHETQVVIWNRRAPLPATEKQERESEARTLGDAPDNQPESGGVIQKGAAAVSPRLEAAPLPAPGEGLSDAECEHIIRTVTLRLGRFWWMQDNPVLVRAIAAALAPPPRSLTGERGPELAEALADLMTAFGMPMNLCGVTEGFNNKSAAEILRFAAKLKRKADARLASPPQRRG